MGVVLVGIVVVLVVVFVVVWAVIVSVETVPVCVLCVSVLEPGCRRCDLRLLCRRPFMPGFAEYGCGRCVPCRQLRRRMWTARLVLESCLHPVSFFVTLTYAPEYLPKDGSLRLRDVQLFLKRFRARIDPRKLRYYAVGEYGERTQRPHYHVLLFGDFLEQEVRECWKLGHVHVGTVTSKSVAYTVQYTVKGMTKGSDPRLKGRTPEFCRMSMKPGIGAGAAPVIAKAFAVTESDDSPTAVRLEGKFWPIGRYLRRKVRREMGLPLETPERVLREHLERVYRRVKAIGGVDEWKQKRGQDQLQAAKYEELRRAKGGQREEI